MADLFLDRKELPEYLLKAGLSWLNVYKRQPDKFKKRLQKYETISNFVTEPEWFLLDKILSFLQKEQFENIKSLLSKNHLEEYSRE
jgi:hypothetical protein